jgi:hypothetical protein
VFVRRRRGCVPFAVDFRYRRTGNSAESKGRTVDITTHPFLNIMWTFFVIFIWIAWFSMLFGIIGDLFRRRDIGGGTKGIWFIFVLFFPFLGALVYVITQGGGMAERNVKNIQAHQAQTDAYIREAAGTGGPAGEIERAKALLDAGVIDEAEFAKLKAAALA